MLRDHQQIFRSLSEPARSALSDRLRDPTRYRRMRPLSREYAMARVLPFDVLPAPEVREYGAGRAPSSVVEHVTFNHGVLGSIPRGPTI